MMMTEQCLPMRSVSIRHAGGLLPATRAPMPTGNQVRELGTCGGFSGPSSALKPGHPEHERKAEARGDSDQGQPEVGGWKEARHGPSYSARSTSCCLSMPRHSYPFLSHEGHCNRKHPCPQWPGEAFQAGQKCCSGILVRMMTKMSVPTQTACYHMSQEFASC